jgi:hypothetical protein
MRLPLLLLAFPLMALPVQAKTTSGTQPAHHRITWEQHFTRANTTHDGHLTIAQAKSGYASLARHFASIDKDNKGYVTEADIRAYYKAQHASRHPSTASKSQPRG